MITDVPNKVDIWITLSHGLHSARYPKGLFRALERRLVRFLFSGFMYTVLTLVKCKPVYGFTFQEAVPEVSLCPTPADCRQPSVITLRGQRPVPGWTQPLPMEVQHTRDKPF